MTQTPGTSTKEEARGQSQGVVPEPRKGIAPGWLQAVLIVGLLGAAVWVYLDGWRLWAICLTVAGVTFGAAFLLRRMVGDEYGRS